jgi:hypothetical protein
VQKLRLMVACAVVLVGAMLPLTASGVPPSAAQATATFEYTKNMHPLGYSPRVVPIDNTVPGQGVFNSDLAFWGNTAVQGTYAGFRLINVEEPDNPTEIVNWTECASPTNTVGNQGDVIVWGDLIIRSWNSETPAPRYPDGTVIPASDPAHFTTPGAFCGDWPMFRTAPLPGDDDPSRGQEGVHIIDISNPTDPDVIGFVDTPCGSHTETLTPDLANNRLLVYSNSSAGTVFGGDPNDPTITSCAGIDIIEVPLSNPAAASYLRFEPSGDPAHDPEEHHSCHDTAVFTGDVNLVACSGSDPAGDGVNVFTTDPAQGGSLVDPKWLYFKDTGGIALGHSASFTWDGKVLIVGHEPGGGSGARCEATDDPLERTFFFLDAPTGASIGQFTIPRPQTNVENCTTHNYNVVPLRDRYVMVSGNYQSGISVVDLTDPANAREIAYADPAPLVDPNPPIGIELGGDWSSYWYNGRIYESDITRGLIIWNLSDKAVAGARKLGHLNPQTQEFNID